MIKEKIVSAIYVIYGLIDIILSTLSTSIPAHMVVLGIICLAAGTGLWMKRTWSIYLLILVGPTTLIAGLATLYSSIGLVGFGSSTQILLLNLFLIGYSAVALGLFIYIIVNRSKTL